MPAKPDWFDMKITLGNVLTLVGMLIGAIWWGSKIETRIDMMHDRTVKLEAADVKLTSQLETMRDLAATRQEGIISQLSVLNARNARIEAILERLERRP